MANTNGQPPLALYVASHSEYRYGRHLVGRLKHHWGADPYRQILGRTGVSVFPRHATAPGPDMPPIRWNSSASTAVVMLVDHRFASEPTWRDYLHQAVEEAEMRGFANRVIPVTMEPGVVEAMDGPLMPRALRWDAWHGEDSARELRLIRELLHQLSRMVQHQLTSTTDQPLGLREYMEDRVRVFISYTWHDDHGKATAEGIRNWIGENSDLSTFFDANDIPPGVSIGDAIQRAIPDCALVACYSDSYSSRDWCQQEVVTAKRHGVPMVVVDCLQDTDHRLFPYLGNVPVVRVNSEADLRIDQILSVLLDEVLRHRLWRSRVNVLGQSAPSVAFTSRRPELCTLATLSDSSGQLPPIVYPGPALGTHEQDLFADIHPSLCMQTLNDWTRSGSLS